MEQLNRIYKDRAAFYGCQPDLFTRTGIRFIAEKKLKDAVTLAKVGRHYLLRYDPGLSLPFRELEETEPGKTGLILNLLSRHFQSRGLSWKDPYIYNYKLDTDLPEPDTEGLKIRQLGESDFPELRRFLSRCSEEDVDEALIDLENPDPVIFGAFAGSELAVYVSHRYFTNGIADIGILTRPDHRRKGYGLAMVNYDTRWCIENDKIPLYTVCRSNTASLKLIEKLEFTALIEVYRLSP